MIQILKPPRNRVRSGVCEAKLRAGIKSAKPLCYCLMISATIRMDHDWETGLSDRRGCIQGALALILE